VNPLSLLPSAGGAAFTVTAGNATTGTFNFNVQGSDGTLTHMQAVHLTVGTDVTWTDAGGGAVTVQAGESANYNFLASPVGGATFSATVSFACANLPALSSCSFSPPSITAGAGTTAVTVTISTTGPNEGSGSKSRNSFAGGRYVIGGDQETMRPGLRSPNAPVALGWLLTFPVAALGMMAIGRKGKRRDLVVGWSIVLLWLAILVACGGAVGGGGGTQPQLVTVSPAIATVVTGGQQKFTASQSVTWAVSGGSANGTIDGSGLYTAPGAVPNPPSFAVTATSAAAGSSPGSAMVTVTNPSVTVTVSPASASAFANETGNTWPVSATQQQFTATVNNASDQSVTWAVAGGNANGTIDANGLYTSPAVVPIPASVAVTATSTQTTAPGSATVNVEPATAVGTYPNIQVTATAAGGAAHSGVVSLTVN
jgi:hypothetical protein